MKVHLKVSRCALKVPDSLKVVHVERIQNLQNWTEFRLKQKEILTELDVLKNKGEAGFSSVCLEKFVLFELFHSS